MHRWTVLAQPASVGPLRRDVAAFAAGGGVHGVLLDDLTTCTSEAVTNSVMHAFRDGRVPGTVSVSATFHPTEFVVTVSDDGMGFAARDDSPGAGLGLPLMRALSSGLSIGASASGGTELELAFALP